MNRYYSVLISLSTFMLVENALATPSTQIWIPSTDVLPHKTIHLGIDNYFRASSNTMSPPVPDSARDANIMDIGLTMGAISIGKINTEIGFDYLTNANEPNDNHPWSGNFKFGTQEDSLFNSSPAIAMGMYNIGKSLSSNEAPLVTSGQNIIYVLLAKTLSSFGRFSVGYYSGSEKALINTSGTADNEDILISWDKTMSEISDKLWLAVDYQGGHNVNGALSFGGSWSFAPNISLILGYDIYTEKTLAGNNTFTTQLDLNF